MSRTPAGYAAQMEDIDELMTTYRRLAEMDPPALRSLADELKRISAESLASAVPHAGQAAQARAGRDARRAAAARAVLAAVETEDRTGDGH